MGGANNIWASIYTDQGGANDIPRNNQVFSQILL